MIVTVPARLFSVPAAVVLNAMFEVSAPRPVPELSTLPFLKVKFVTFVPVTPLSDVLSILTLVNDGFIALLSAMPLVRF